MKDKKYFCYEIFKNISVISHNGKIQYSPCSWYSGHTSESDTIDIKTALQSNEHQKLKEMIMQDQSIPGCYRCYRDEKNGLQSRRMGAKQQYEEFFKDTNIDENSLTGLDYSLGNLCNLKCTVCEPMQSSSWKDDWKKLHPTDSTIYDYDKRNQIHFEDKSVLKDLKFIHFHGGGEPLMVDNHIKVLEKIDDLSQTRVAYNTNGTIRPGKEVLEIWEKCKLVEIYFSIDAVGDKFEYQRTNADWQEVNDNIEWFKENMPHNHMFNVNCVWSLLNVYYLDQLVDWKREKLDTNRYGDPVNLIFQKAWGPTEINYLRPQALGALGRKYQNYPELLKLIDPIPAINKSQIVFDNYIEKLDKIRGFDYKSLHKEWSELL
jgi:MoaA/NifB/PqqE/SkfB family radical SAM enzyme